MIRLDISCPEKLLPEEAERCIEGAAVDLGFTLRLKTTLKAYPGSLHWHYCRAASSGTLEATLRPGPPCTLWLSVQSGRKAFWTDDGIAALGSEIARRFAPEPTQEGSSTSKCEP